MYISNRDNCRTTSERQLFKSRKLVSEQEINYEKISTQGPNGNGLQEIRNRHYFYFDPSNKQSKFDLQRRTWTTLNLLRTGHKRSGHKMHK